MAVTGQDWQWFCPTQTHSRPKQTDFISSSLFSQTWYFQLSDKLTAKLMASWRYYQKNVLDLLCKELHKVSCHPGDLYMYKLLFIFYEFSLELILGVPFLLCEPTIQNTETVLSGSLSQLSLKGGKKGFPLIPWAHLQISQSKKLQTSPSRTRGNKDNSMGNMYHCQV